MNIEETLVGDWVKERPLSSQIFQKLNIDYCCGGKRTIKEACETSGIDSHMLVNQLAGLERKSATVPGLDFNAMSLSFLSDYIYEVHHKYLYEKLPEIDGLVNKVTAKHGEKYSWLAELSQLFAALKNDLEGHLPKEEEILFPYIKEMEQNSLSHRPPFQTIQNPLAVMNAEHDEAGEILHRLRVITSDYTPPEDACNSHLAMLAMLKDLDDNLIQHIHLENNILFPKAEKMESEQIALI
ncbi:iron-sulfur cluster repair di-iron protein [Jiulongibacter sediminis]|uniref:Hemerythrin-like domain-containing protein n=1 Tax=Jiulongibacter sediminis TaxID=1605367 RepID=A0A0P7BN77_9BACT|nr:iron-sulfur cluster repair di-iron protein [Jiulongibacter sediminis]KPM46781.1 hypothetical protein AFM12_18690 [Jiulongibacter sediminis]TBX21685.1 hypothetical protein TK44_18695 [Jiulongibacter sediminis]